MTTFPIHDLDSAPEDSKPTLTAAKQAFGAIPNLFGVFAESPALLKAYTTVDGLLQNDTAFDATERQVVFMTVSFDNECDYCMAAHSTISRMQGVPADVVTALRDGSPLPTAKLEALRTFTSRLVESRGWAGEDAVQTFLDAGYTRRHVLEVVLGIAFKTLSNYTNHLAATPVDAGFAPNAWSKPEAVA